MTPANHRQAGGGGNNKKNRKMFNKREYFKQKHRAKYGSHLEGRGLDAQQKKKIVRDYQRLQRKEGKRRLQTHENTAMTFAEGDGANLGPSPSSHGYPAVTDEDSPLAPTVKKKKKGSMQRAREEYHKKIAEKRERIESHERKKREVEEAERKYKERRVHRFKKLSQRTTRGQPVMKGKIELMVEQLEEEMRK